MICDMTREAERPMSFAQIKSVTELTELIYSLRRVEWIEHRQFNVVYHGGSSDIIINHLAGFSRGY